MGHQQKRRQQEEDAAVEVKELFFQFSPEKNGRQKIAKGDPSRQGRRQIIICQKQVQAVV